MKGLDNLISGPLTVVGKALLSKAALHLRMTVDKPQISSTRLKSGLLDGHETRCILDYSMRTYGDG